MRVDTTAHLVVYDYGQGGVWARVRAESRAQLEREYPELMVVNSPPSWMSDDELAALPVLDIAQPSGILGDLRRP